MHEKQLVELENFVSNNAHRSQRGEKVLGNPISSDREHPGGKFNSLGYSEAQTTKTNMNTIDQES